MRAVDIIEKKKSFLELSDEEIRFLVDGYTKGDIPDYQMSAFTMAVCFTGMSDAETASLTSAMANSGDMLDLSRFGGLSADKHSTGGVGDKTTLVVAPVIAALGGKIAKMSGRGLGHTGGTVDKLEAIPGYRTSLSETEFLDTAEKCGVCVIGQTGTLSPADKKLYALRDVTATVDSIPLIASSIMSKKLAAGAGNIVLDVKTGSGAFMKKYDDSKALAKAMVEIGKRNGRKIKAVITDMNTPLGHAVGNSLEVREAIDTLSGRGPEDLTEICSCLAGQLLSLIHGGSAEKWIEKAGTALSDGSALEVFRKWITAQGGADVVSEPLLLGGDVFSLDVISPADGFVCSTDTKEIGHASLLCGAGRSKLGDKIDLCAGIMLRKKRGEAVLRGDVLATVYSSDKDKLNAAKECLLSAYSFSDTAPESLALIYETIE